MNKADLVDAVANAAAIGKREVDQVVAELIVQITRALQAGEKVNLAGIGALSTAATKPRMGRNPRTGVAVRIPAGVRVKFAASSTLKRAVASSKPKAAAGAAGTGTGSKGTGPAKRTSPVRAKGSSRTAPAGRATTRTSPARSAATKSKRVGATQGSAARR